MGSTRYTTLGFAVTMALALVCLGSAALSSATSNEAQEGQQSASASATAKPVGVVKAISGNTITLATDAGSTVNIVVQDSARLVRIAPGQKDLKEATPIQLQDVQVGDRILARGTASEDGKSVAASSVVLMKESDVDGEAGARSRRLAEARRGRIGEQSRCAQTGSSRLRPRP